MVPLQFGFPGGPELLVLFGFFAIALQRYDVDELEPTDVASVAMSAWTIVPTDEAELHVDGNPTVHADPSRLQQALENLFRNAIEHVGPSVTVRVGGLESPGFYVEDDGPGIPSDVRDQVFEPGFTTDTDSTGFGLNIVQEIATSHGWSVTPAEGEPGGTRFEFNTSNGT